ncbi:MAG: insulinase family protein [Oscillospiraceae bacterium]|nr:insulinase family protein [Oscillospiraceae bacterium]
MEKIYYPEVGETLYKTTLSCGLPVAVLPRPGFTKKLCYFVTDYGSIHTAFTADGRSCTAPAGVAHYLEHKLFDMPGRDITEEFAALGAIPNAFTSYDMTAYYFSCTDYFKENLELLLGFVTTPYFTEESVAKEQGIIGQEIDMNEDNPDNKLFELLMDAMYENHPIRTPILGTRQSIAKITPEVLETCHNAFYRPENMFLCVVGDVEPEEVAALAEAKLQTVSSPVVTARRSWDEPMTVRKDFVTMSMEVAMPMFQLGFKCEPLPDGDEGVRREIVGDLAAEALFGESSRLYLKLYDEGLIDSSFGGGYETIEGMSMLVASGDSEDPAAVRDAILKEAQYLAQVGITEEDFLRMKRSALGRRIRSLDSFESTCFRICAYHFSKFDYFRIPGIYQQITKEEVQKFLQAAVTHERMCMAVITPKEEEN